MKLISFFAIFLLMITGQVSVAQELNKLDEKGLKHGPWKGYFEESKRVKYEGVFDHGKESGVFTFYDDTKAHTVVATRDFSKGGNSAYTKFYDARKNVVSEGNIVNKQYDGEWKYYHKGSKAVMTSEFYKNGKLNGKRMVFYPDGKIAEEANFVNDIKNGPYKKYSPNGVILEEVTFANGEIEGLGIYRNPDGKITSKGNYVKGLKKGVWEFYENGKLVKKEKHPIVRKFAKLPKKQEN